MAFMRKSLSQDAVDRYCETWAFLFLLLLAISFLFLPLSPSMSFIVSPPSQKAQHPGKPNVHEIQKTRYPKYKALCWTPPHFTKSMHNYVESACSSALNSIAEGKKLSNAGVYKLRSEVHDEAWTGIFTREDLLPSLSDSMTPKDDQDQPIPQSIDNRIKTEGLRHDRHEFQSGTKKLILYKTPLFLLVFAICLRLPHAIWALFSTCCGCVNVDRTLLTAEQMRSKDADGNRKFRKEMSVTLGKSSQKSCCVLYLLMKLLMFAVLLAGFKVNHDLVMEIDTLENDWGRLKSMNEDTNTRLVKPSLEGHGDGSSSNVSQPLIPPFGSSVMLCDFSLRILSNVQHYSVQCLFTVDQDSVTNGKTSAKTKNAEATMNDEPDYEKILLMYKCLFTIVLSLLIVLALLTLGSLVTWIVKLLLPSCRPCMGLKGDEAWDEVFMVAMAWMNTSPMVAMEIAKCTAVSNNEEGDAFELK